MLTALPSQSNLGETSFETLKSKDLQLDCSQYVPTLTQIDTIDNPFIPETNIFDKMKYERNRLYSFQNKWPLQEITPESLAEAGLFYLQHEDKVQCPFCFIVISNWTRGDNPLREHMRRRPKCTFLMGCETGNVPLNPAKHQNTLNSIPERHPVSFSYKPKHPRFADVKNRILTFSGWPLNWPTPQQLAECGMYYSGLGDIVTCFFCDGTLGNWEPNDDPWNEHAKFFPNCAFLAIAKSRNSSRNLKQLENSKAFIEFKQEPVKGMPSSNLSDIMEEAQDIFPRNLILEAVKRKGGNIVSLQELCDDILELKQSQKLDKKISVPIPDVTPPIPTSSSNADILLCKVCLDKEKGAVFQPCGHFVSCWNCANLIANCPVCRRPITHRIRTYNS